MLWCVLYGSTVWWYYGLVCYGVYCMEVLFGGIIDLFVWRLLYGGSVCW